MHACIHIHVHHSTYCIQINMLQLYVHVHIHNIVYTTTIYLGPYMLTWTPQRFTRRYPSHTRDYDH